MLGVAVGVALASFTLMGQDTHHGNGLLALGGLAFTLYPLCVAYTNDFLEPVDLIPASGGLVMAYGLGAAIGPLGAAGAVQVVGVNG